MRYCYKVVRELQTFHQYARSTAYNRWLLASEMVHQKYTFPSRCMYMMLIEVKQVVSASVFGSMVDNL